MRASYRMAADPSASGEACLTRTGNGGAACGMLPVLEATIRRLHRMVGNANVDGDRHIVLALGSTQVRHGGAPVRRPRSRVGP